MISNKEHEFMIYWTADVVKYFCQGFHVLHAVSICSVFAVLFHGHDAHLGSQYLKLTQNMSNTMTSTNSWKLPKQNINELQIGLAETLCIVSIYHSFPRQFGPNIFPNSKCFLTHLFDPVLAKDIILACWSYVQPFWTHAIKTYPKQCKGIICFVQTIFNLHEL